MTATTHAMPQNAVLPERFTANAAAVGAHVRHVANDSELARRVEELAAGGRVSIAPALAADRPALLDALSARGLAVAMPDVDDPAGSFAGVTVGVSRAVQALAETGSLVVTDRLADRLVRMLAPVHVLVLDSDAVVPGLDEAGTFLQEQVTTTGDSAARYVSFITGPSRTADIEMSLTVGAHGPAELHVALLSPPARQPVSHVDTGVRP